MINASATLALSLKVALLLTIASHAGLQMNPNAREADPNLLAFLNLYHASRSAAYVTTHPEHVERVRMYSLVFSKGVAARVLRALNRELNGRRGWKRDVSTPGEYVSFDRTRFSGNAATITSVSYMSDEVYRGLEWPPGERPLPVMNGGCVVEYFDTHYKRRR